MTGNAQYVSKAARRVGSNEVLGSRTCAISLTSYGAGVGVATTGTDDAGPITSTNEAKIQPNLPRTSTCHQSPSTVLPTIGAASPISN